MYRQYGCGVCGHDFKDDVPEVPAEVEEADPPDGEISSGREWDFVKHIMIMVQHTFSRKRFKDSLQKSWLESVKICIELYIDSILHAFS